MTIRGAPSDYWLRTNYRVEIDGVVYAGFRDCSPIGGDREVAEHREGGSNYAFKKLATETYDDITLTAGLSDMNNELYEWWNSGRPGGRDRALRRSDLLRTVHIIQMDEEGNDVYAWTLYNAQPKRYEVGGWDKGAAEVTIKTLILVYEYFEEERLVA